MVNKQHGHIVLEFLAAQAGKAVTRKELDEYLEKNFGKDIRFHVCEGEDMTIDDLFDFLRQRAKIKETEEGILFNPNSEICEHG